MNVRHRQTGDLARVTEEDGEKFVTYDRPYGPKLPYRPNDWIEEVDAPPLNRSQLARVAFAADRQLLYFQHYTKSKRGWEALTDQERISWNEKGPVDGDKVRKKLYDAIMKCLSPLTVK